VTKIVSQNTPYGVLVSVPVDVTASTFRLGTKYQVWDGRECNSRVNYITTRLINGYYWTGNFP